MKSLLTLIACFVLALGFTQEPPKTEVNTKPVRKIKILHADPQMIMMILEGKTWPQYPEYAQTQYQWGRSFGGGNFGKGGFGGGNGS